MVVGVVGALGAVVFRGLIALFHNLLFLGQWSFVYDANVHTPPSPWGPFVILVPVLGAAGVAFLVSHFAPEAKGHGVPEVMDAIYYNKGVIRPVVAVIKSLASALSIGSGGSVGREGPIVQIGSSFGSTLGQLLRRAGVAAHHPDRRRRRGRHRRHLQHADRRRALRRRNHAPRGQRPHPGPRHHRHGDGVVHRPARLRQPSLLRDPRASRRPTSTTPTRSSCCFYLGLGVLMGLVSVVYIRSIYAFEDFFEKRVPGNYYIRHMLGMLAVGIIMYVLLRTTGHYHVEGVGYATVQDVLSGEVSWFLLALFALKLLATSLTLGSGASGGVFSPALYLGATLGGVYGLALHQLFPGLPIHPAAFAVAGMAGVVGGSTGAALAAIVMIFEMTLDYTVIIPMTITVALSYGVRDAAAPPEHLHAEARPPGARHP